MNARQWKKAEKQAAARISVRFPGRYEFTAATGDETVSRPRSYRPRLSSFRRYDGVRKRWSRSPYAEPPPGTPIVWECSGYYEPEWDCRLPSDIEERENENAKVEAMSDEEAIAYYGGCDLAKSPESEPEA